MLASHSLTNTGCCFAESRRCPLRLTLVFKCGTADSMGICLLKTEQSWTGSSGGVWTVNAQVWDTPNKPHKYSPIRGQPKRTHWLCSRSKMMDSNFPSVFKSQRNYNNQKTQATWLEWTHTDSLPFIFLISSPSACSLKGKGLTHFTPLWRGNKQSLMDTFFLV